MFGIDHSLANLTPGATLLVVIAVAILLGLRHATDPDHLTAVFTLILTEDGTGRRVRRASTLGMAWGLGHATTLFLLGLPLVLFGPFLPEVVQEGAEAVIGLLIVALAIRLIVRWRRLHVHEHRHEHPGREHTHVHVHERGRRRRPWRRRGTEHRHPKSPKDPKIRSPAQAYSVGFVHGIGGSAGVGILLLSSIPSHTLAITALFLFAVCTAISMASLSTALGYALARRNIGPFFEKATPVMGVVSLAFGVWYMLGAVQLAPYPF